MNASYKYIFGPVPSRRFGRSLGVDLTPHKTCSLDCVFCQLGRTKGRTVVRKEYVPVGGVIAEIEVEQMVKGLRDFRFQFKGELWLEVFLLSGINSMPSDVKKISAIAKQIKPDRIHLNSVFRPPAEDFAKAPAKNSMKALRHLFDPPAEIIEECKMDSPKNVHGEVNHDILLSLLQRRPCTMNQIAEVFGLHINEVSKHLGRLVRFNHIRAHSKNKAVYYYAVIKEDKHNSLVSITSESMENSKEGL